MNNKQLKRFLKTLIYIDVDIHLIQDFDISISQSEAPFPNCKVIEVTHLSFFAPRAHMPRYFVLEGDKFKGRTDLAVAGDEVRSFWLPLTPEDDWVDILWKTDKLAALSGNRHHRILEGFSVVEDILIPCFGS
jgi:hypothetical protein